MTQSPGSVDPLTLAAGAAEAVRRRLRIPSAEVALVLGSGWSEAVAELEVIGRVPLAALPGFHTPAVAGHGGELLAVRITGDRCALVFTGRTHHYEGRGVAAVVHGVRTAAACGVRTVVLTNGSGSLRREWGPGTPVLIRDHINLTGVTPLVGPRFVDMSEAYAGRLRDLARTVDPSLPEGVYVQFPGPQYETPAEVRMAGVLGGDLVGMSTVLETIAARERGLEVLGLSLATNLAAGISQAPLDHREVIAAGQAAAPRLRSLITELLAVL
ncbi:purine-nucleoside phosphorylase [Granulicoccus phenolivorans]|uniref:purine-nucleoside phosphorylase n=1 Tax=Granulicoccus phenolivorans TaxID=266854 RepID=UPI0003FD3E40|nr:purine-nucleoside phosphorylase [Granulicoccus phenolivorans]